MVLKGTVKLPGSKSIANRILLMKAIAGAELDFVNLPESNDVIVLKKCLETDNGTCFFEDAGTPLRFYLTYVALRGNDERVIDGFERLKERPIKPLLEALEFCGAEFNYLEKAYSLPLKVVKALNKDTKELSISASVSSQFISALMLIAPYLNNGLIIRLKGEMRSAPYVKMTMALMNQYGVRCEYEDTAIVVGAGQYLFDSTEIESDWSAAAFFYNLMAVGRKGDILLEGLDQDSIQGDHKIIDYYRELGVQTDFEVGGVRIRCEGDVPANFEVDLRDTPDVFPALCATVVALRIPSVFKGIRNLRDKESDRVEAMANNSKLMGATFRMTNDDELSISFDSMPEEKMDIQTYGDHRIAMACSVFAMKAELEIDVEEVVSKSFPSYWEVFNQLYGNLAKKVSE